MEKRREQGQLLLSTLKSSTPPDVTAQEIMDVVKDILSRGCDWTKAVDNDGYTVLHLVAKFWNDVIMNMFLEHGIRAFKSTINAKDNHCCTALHLACKHNNISVRNFLLSKTDDIDLDLHTLDNNGACPLTTVVRALDVVGTRNMLDAGACTLYPDMGGYSNPLYSIRYHYHHSTINDFVEDREKAVVIFQMLLEPGPPLALCKQLNIAPCIPEVDNFIRQIAEESDLEEDHVLLFEKGWIKVPMSQALPIWHTNPFVQIAIRNDMVRLIETLYRCGVDMTSTKSTGGHILHDAVLRGGEKVVQFIVDTVKIDSNEEHPLFKEIPLHVAAKWNHHKAALILCKRCGDFRRKDKFGKTPLEVAMAKRNFEVSKVLAYVPSLYPGRIIRTCMDSLIPDIEEDADDDDEPDPTLAMMRTYLINITKSYPRSLAYITAEFIRLRVGISQVTELLERDMLTMKCKNKLALGGITLQDIMNFGETTD